MKDKFIKAYTENITRPGADKLLAWIESSDFFTAPASTRFHLSSPGGLLEHSLHVFERMKAICANEATITPGFNEPSMETIAVCGLLHDICKANFYAVEMRNRKNDQGRWEQYPFYVVDDKLPYEAICCGAEGADEIVVRKFIESSVGMTPCIYNGLPLRPEFRVFYDFDARKPIFTANYWDYDYVYPHLYHATDKIIFEHERERLEGVYAHFKDAVQDKVADAMQNVQGLTGQWSVDVLMDEREKFWLIDMAIAQRSAYWEMRPEGYAE